MDDSLQRVCLYPKRFSAFNKISCGLFESSCGLRQGNPLYRYLFIIDEEILSLHIQQQQKDGKIQPVSKVPSLPCPLHYVDGILLFGRLSSSRLRAIHQTSASQLINLHKRQLKCWTLANSALERKGKFPPSLESKKLLVVLSTWEFTWPLALIQDWSFIL